MEVPSQHSQHERAQELPLLTDSATVSSVDHLDENRTEEIVDRVFDLLDQHGRDEVRAQVERLAANDIDWDELESLLDEEDYGNLRTVVDTLRKRFERSFPGLLQLRFEFDDEFDFVPGQYATVRFEDTPRPYSIASSPNDDAIETAVRRVPGGRLTSKMFSDISEGDEVVLRGPNGEFVLQEPSTRDMAFLATGTGVAPLKSMIEFTFEEGRDEVGGERRDLWLFLGASWEDDLPYRERFRELDDERENFHFVPTCSREEYLTDWDGETSYVQQTLVKYLTEAARADLDGKMAGVADQDPKYDVDARVDPSDLEVYACGINVMVGTLVDTVRSLGVPDEYVEFEGFG
ncbi:FAD-binding oxidoreductase [Halomicrococcus sp. NG-SE-24]|uniref:FAD-binding oxidoreductase n=1 Tax=Halomicrococcus sp. NG-SE-24 TaxID=3436928 RepID=UPI003D96B8A1